MDVASLGVVEARPLQISSSDSCCRTLWLRRDDLEKGADSGRRHGAADLILADIGDWDAIAVRKLRLAEAKTVAEPANPSSNVGTFQAGNAYVAVLRIIRVGRNRYRSLVARRDYCV